MSELLTLQQIEDSKIYQKEGIAYSHPMQIAEPFFNAFGRNDYLVKVDREVTNINDNGTKNISYGRILLQKIFGTEEINATVGMIIAFDVQQIKLFAGANVSACTNLCVFNPAWLVNTKIGIRLQSHVDNLEDILQHKLDFDKEINRMNLSFLSKDNVHKLHSQMILEHRKSKDKALYGESFTNKAFADLLMPDSKSPYAIEGESTSEWNVYNALTQQLSDSKDILYVPSKSFEAYEMIKNLTIN
jgi:hypothetical protein